MEVKPIKRYIQIIIYLRSTNMQTFKHIYSFNYDEIENDLCKLESRYVFNKEEKNKLLFSDIKIEPSTSAFLKKRFDIILSSNDYSTLIEDIKKEKIHFEGFKVEYLVLHGDTTEYKVRLKKLKDIGLSIEGDPDYYNPTITYGLSYYEDVWYFGVLTKDIYDWHKHNQKPRSYSNSINISLAKTLVNIAAKGNKETKLIDACCGVGTIMLEACFSGFNIEGCDINWKICKDVKENLSHFNYTAKIHHSDIKDISERYDAAIIDLPYNLFSKATDDDVLHILKSTAEISDRLIIVSTSDITDIIKNIGFTISDYCKVRKYGKTKFSRKVWVCEKNI